MLEMHFAQSPSGSAFWLPRAELETARVIRMKHQQQHGESVAHQKRRFLVNLFVRIRRHTRFHQIQFPARIGQQHQIVKGRLAFLHGFAVLRDPLLGQAFGAIDLGDGIQKRSNIAAGAVQQFLKGIPCATRRSAAHPRPQQHGQQSSPSPPQPRGPCSLHLRFHFESNRYPNINIHWL